MKPFRIKRSDQVEWICTVSLSLHIYRRTLRISAVSNSISGVYKAPQQFTESRAIRNEPTPNLQFTVSDGPRAGAASTVTASSQGSRKRPDANRAALRTPTVLLFKESRRQNNAAACRLCAIFLDALFPGKWRNGGISLTRNQC